jgi:hypothetical protein
MQPLPLELLLELLLLELLLLELLDDEQMSSCVAVDDCSQVPAGQVPLVAVHCSQAPKSTLALCVSQTGVAPLQAPPLSPHEHWRHPVSVVPVHTGRSGPVLVHLPWALLQSSWTYQVRPLTTTVSSLTFAGGTQMSAISPQLLSPQAAGAA